VGSKFSDGLKKTAGIIGSAAKAITNLAGGKLNAVLTAADASNQFSQNMKRVTSMQTPRGPT